MPRPLAVAGLALALSLSLGLSACATSGGPRPLSTAHTLFPGTRVSMALPPGYRHAPALPGFESEDRLAAIFANEVPGSVYSTLRSFSGEAFQKNGMLLVEQERVTVDGWPGRLYRASQPLREVELSRLVVVFGDGSMSIVLTAVAPSEVWEARVSALRETLLSTHWHREGPPEAPAEPEGVDPS